MALRVAALVHAGADGAYLRHRVREIHAASELVIVAVRSTASRTAPPPPRIGLGRRVVQKARGLYATLNYPPRYYALTRMVVDAEERWLPPSPPLTSYDSYRVFDVPKVNSEETRAILKRAGADVIIPLTGGIVKPVLLDAAPLGLLNTHYAWLPLLRGLWSTAYSIIENRPDWLGVTVHKMDAGIDTGPILRRARPVFSKRDDHEALWVRMDLMAAQLLRDELGAIEAGRSRELPNPAAEGVYRSRLCFRDHLKLQWRQRRFFKRYGDPACPALSSSG